MAYDETQRGRGKFYSDLNRGSDQTVEWAYLRPQRLSNTAINFAGFVDEKNSNIFDGSTDNKIQLKDQGEYEAKAGDVVIVVNEDGVGEEYMWDGKQWQRFGPTGAKQTIKVIDEDGVAPTLKDDDKDISKVIYNVSVSDETLYFNLADFFAGSAPTTKEVEVMVVDSGLDDNDD